MEERAQNLTLPSGREVTVRPPGALEHWYCTEALPDLGAPAAPTDPKKLTQRDENAAAITLICACVTAPRLHADLRSQEDRARSPIKVPDGMIEFDLSLQDFAFLSDWLQKRILEEAADVRPTSPTGGS